MDRITELVTRREEAIRKGDEALVMNLRDDIEVARDRRDRQEFLDRLPK